MNPVEIAVTAGLVSGFVSVLGIVLNFVLNAKRERRFASLQTTQIEIEAFNAVRMEAEIIRKELRGQIQEQQKEIDLLEKENRRLEKELGTLAHSHIVLQREYELLEKTCAKQDATNELLRKDVDDLRRRL